MDNEVNLNGFILEYRSLLDWEWFKDCNTAHLFEYLRLAANYIPKKWNGITIQRGQLACSRKSLAKNTGLSEQQTRTALKHLISTNEITIKSTKGYSIITVVNYKKYQDIGNNPTKQPTKVLTNDQPTINQPSTNDQPILNNINKENNVTKREAPTAFLIFGENGNVQLTEEQHRQFVEDYPETAEDEIERLSAYMAETGKKYASHIAVLRRWAKEDEKKAKAEPEKYADLMPMYLEHLRQQKEAEQ